MMRKIGTDGKVIGPVKDMKKEKEKEEKKTKKENVK
jgi:hypothetical protein